MALAVDVRLVSVAPPVGAAQQKSFVARRSRTVSRETCARRVGPDQEAYLAPGPALESP
jgi:hypothetical protein